MSQPTGTTFAFGLTAPWSAGRSSGVGNLTAVAADGGAMERAEPLAALVSTASKHATRGIGSGSAYLVRRDEDDLEHLQRYKLP